MSSFPTASLSTISTIIQPLDNQNPKGALVRKNINIENGTEKLKLSVPSILLNPKAKPQNIDEIFKYLSEPKYNEPIKFTKSIGLDDIKPIYKVLDSILVGEKGSEQKLMDWYNDLATQKKPNLEDIWKSIYSQLRSDIQGKLPATLPKTILDKK